MMKLLISIIRTAERPIARTEMLSDNRRQKYNQRQTVAKYCKLQALVNKTILLFYYFNVNYNYTTLQRRYHGERNYDDYPMAKRHLTLN